MLLIRDSRSAMTPFMAPIAVTSASSCVPISAVISAMDLHYPAVDWFESEMKVS